jgi:hypothetical protein
MPELVVIVPSRGRPHTVAELAEAFRATCTADTALCIAVDETDPALERYAAEVEEVEDQGGGTLLMTTRSSTMPEALNAAVRQVLTWPDEPAAVASLGDDHRPRTSGWDRAYLRALAARPGIVYGNDLFQGPNLPTQCAMSTAVVRALGHMAPPVLRHLFVDNYWLALGRAADCISYRPRVVIEHMHPFADKAPMDEGYQRVNRPEVYRADEAAFEAYWAEHREREVAAVLTAVGRSAG